MDSGLSVAIVCRDNERTIGRTLESVRGLADEIVALDSGSVDGTLGILKEHGVRVIGTQWLGHVATKQKALEACKGRWVLCLDSDESVEPELAAAIRAVVEGEGADAIGYRVNRKVWYAGRFLEHAWQPEWRLRLIQRGKGRWGGLDPHDKLEILGGGVVGDLKGDLRHDSFVDMAEHLANQVRHAQVMATSLAGEGRKGGYGRLLVSPGGAFLKQMVLRGAWRDGWRGWAAAGSTAAATLMKHILLLERSQEEKAGGDEGREKRG